LQLHLQHLQLTLIEAAVAVDNHVSKGLMLAIQQIQMHLELIVLLYRHHVFDVLLFEFELLDFGVQRLGFLLYSSRISLVLLLFLKILRQIKIFN
jgi:hypothetical protein